MELLEVHDVAVAYGKLRAVKGVSFTVRRGEVVALLGSNGSGKSTLLRTIAGVLAPGNGRIVFDGDDITGWPSHRVARRGLRLVPEGRGLLARMSVWENLLMGQYAGGGDCSRSRCGAGTLPGARSAPPARSHPRCPAVSSRCWPSPARWWRGRRC